MVKKFSFLDKARLIEKDKDGRPIKAEIDYGDGKEIKNATIIIKPPLSKSFLKTIFVYTNDYDWRFQLRTDRILTGKCLEDKLEKKVDKAFGKFSRPFKPKKSNSWMGVNKSAYEIERDKEMNKMKSLNMVGLIPKTLGILMKTNCSPL